MKLNCKDYQTSELEVQKVGKKRDFSVLKRSSLPCYSLNRAHVFETHRNGFMDD